MFKTNKRITISNDTPIPFNFLELVVYILLAGCTLHRHVDCGNPLFSVCVPTLDINHHRNVKVVFEVLISDFFTLRSKHEMLRKVPKIKDFYEVFLCIDTIVSTCSSLSKLKFLPTSKKALLWKSILTVFLYCTVNIFNAFQVFFFNWR